VLITTDRSVFHTSLENSDDELEILSQDVKKLVQVVQNLHHLKMKDFILSLSKIIVVINQSTKELLSKDIKFFELHLS